MWGDLLTESFGNYVSQHTYIYTFVCLYVLLIHMRNLFLFACLFIVKQHTHTYGCSHVGRFVTFASLL